MRDARSFLRYARSLPSFLSRRGRFGRRWTPGAAWRRAREIVAEDGIRTLWFRVLGETVYRRLIIVECELDPPPPLREARIDVEYGFLSPDDVGDLQSLPAEAVPPDALARLRRGQRCWVARHRGRIISMRWLAEGEVEIEYLGCTLRMAHGEVYLFQSFADPAYRNHGVSAGANSHLAHALAATGRTRLVGAVMPENRPSRRMLENVGYRPAGLIGCVRLGPWRYDFVRRRDPTG